METSTKEFYERLSGKSLSDQEAFEAKSNFVGFFDLLYRIDQRNEKKKRSSKSKKNLKK